MTREEQRLAEARERKVHWKRWGPYLSERAWGTVREDYSEHGTAWDYLPHDHARSRAYRWNEDGIAGVSDRHQILCFSVALWNHRDPILKERLFGLTRSEGNHGEDVKELYYYLDSTPTHSYMRMLYSTRRPSSRTRSCSTRTGAAAVTPGRARRGCAKLDHPSDRPCIFCGQGRSATRSPDAPSSPHIRKEHTPWLDFN